jgi:chromodomain-helicase-DNA-binding protein 4
VGKIAIQFDAYPALIVVPNSTVTNWVREFERWAPVLRVVPFYGETNSREVIRTFEFKYKYHVLITPYEAINNPKDFTRVFKEMSPVKV